MTRARRKVNILTSRGTCADLKRRGAVPEYKSCFCSRDPERGGKIGGRWKCKGDWSELGR
jgi:hypothetical protein